MTNVRVSIFTVAIVLVLSAIALGLLVASLGASHAGARVAREAQLRRTQLCWRCKFKNTFISDHTKLIPHLY